MMGKCCQQTGIVFVNVYFCLKLKVLLITCKANYYNYYKGIAL